MPILHAPSSQAWLETVLADFEAFLLDHAACERKASATALSLMTHYPDRAELVRAMNDLALEELEHFHAVVRLIDARGLQLGKDRKDEYVVRMRDEIRRGRDHYFLDRLLVSGIVEARGCERFGMVADALEPSELKDFYRDITRSEAQHHGLFVRLAKLYFEAGSVDARHRELLAREAKIVAELPLRSAVH